MARRSSSFLLRVALPAALALALAGCSGTKEVSEADVEDQAATKLAEQVKQPKPNVDCPGPLKAEEGATMDCVLVAQGDTDRYNVKVVVSSIDGDTVNMTFEVGEAPLP